MGKESRVSFLLAWLLNAVYLTLLVVASPWIVWTALKHGKYSEGFAEKLLGRVPRRAGQQPCVWLHAVSVGEVNLLETTLAEIARREPKWELVISTTTKAGYDLARRKYSNHSVFYCPLDFTWAVSTALRRVRPDLLVLAELELWPNLIRAAKQFGASVAIINGRLSDNSFRGISVYDLGASRDAADRCSRRAERRNGRAVSSARRQTRSGDDNRFAKIRWCTNRL